MLDMRGFWLAPMAVAMGLAGPETPPVYSARTVVPDGGKRAAALAPGMIVSIYGYHLGPEAGCVGTADPVLRETANPLRPVQAATELAVFPKRLCDVEVRVGGVAAGLLYVQAMQINFQVPQEVGVTGATEVSVAYRGQSGIAARVRLGSGPRTEPAEKLAEQMWAGLQAVRWGTVYHPGAVCGAVPVTSNLRAGLDGYAYYCTQAGTDVVGESFYYPAGESEPAALLRRVDFRMAAVYPAMSAEVERVLAERLRHAYGPGVVPKGLYAIGAETPNPGLSWRVGDVTVFLNRNLNYVPPSGVHEGVTLIAVRREVLGEEEKERHVEEAFGSSTELSLPVIEADLEKELGAFYAAPKKAEHETLAALLGLLRGAKTGERGRRAAMLVAADDLTVRLGGLLVNAPDADRVRQRLVSNGIHYFGPGHYSGEFEYDRFLLRRAWREFPERAWGQRAFLMLQQASCEVPDFGGLESFRGVIRQGEKFLSENPETSFRKEQLYFLAVANETEWSLSKAAPGDPTAEGAHVDRASAERARERAIALYEELIRTAPGSAEADAGRLALPRRGRGRGRARLRKQGTGRRRGARRRTRGDWRCRG